MKQNESLFYVRRSINEQQEMRRRSNSGASSCRLSSRTTSTALSSRSSSPLHGIFSCPRSPVDEAFVDDPRRFLIEKARSASPASKLKQLGSPTYHPALIRSISPTDLGRLDSPRQVLREKIRSASPSEIALRRRLTIDDVDHVDDMH